MATKKLELAQAREKLREEEENREKRNKKIDDLNFELHKKQEASAEMTLKMCQLEAELLEARQRLCFESPSKTNGLSLLGKRNRNPLEVEN